MSIAKKPLTSLGAACVLAAVSSAAFAGRYIPATGVPVEGQFIVVFKDDAPGSAAAARLSELAAQHRGQVARAYEHVLNGGVMRMTEAQAEALARNPRVDYVEQDSVVQLIVPAATVGTVTQSPATWGLDRIDQRALPLDGSYVYGADGFGVTAYIIDTGIRISHSEFGGRAAVAYDALGGTGLDCHGHGTHVAGTVGGATYGVAKGVKLAAVRVLDCNGSGTTSGVIAGVDWVGKNAAKPAVANMSLGGGASFSLDTAVKNAIASGVTFALAAGNNNADACKTSPARLAQGLTVGATTATDARASYSNYGKCLDLFAPGSSITSAWYTSDTAAAVLSGTSMATPHATGAAALYLQTNPSASPSTVSAALTAGATAGVVGSAGTGSPNRLLFSQIP